MFVSVMCFDHFSYAEHWGWNKTELEPVRLKERFIVEISNAGNHMSGFFGTAYGFILNIGNFVVSFFIFLGCIIYLTQVRTIQCVSNL
jgi:hypothetical protein